MRPAGSLKKSRDICICIVKYVLYYNQFLVLLSFESINVQGIT